MRHMFQALVIAGLAAGCAGKPSAPATSALRGQIQQETFAAPVSAITVVNDRGVITKVPVGASGAFKLSLAAGTGYRFFLSADGKGTPLVLRNNNGNLETGLLVKAGGATVDIGAVRFVSPGAVTRSLAVRPGAGGQAAQSCSDGNDGEQNDDHSDGEQNDDGGGDCVDGIDAQTQQPCDGGPAANQNDGELNDDPVDDGEQNDDQADPSLAMGVANLSAPSSIGCSGGETSDGDGEEDDD